MRYALFMALCAGMVSVSAAVSIINTDFTTPYVNGNIDTQQGWADLPLTGGFSFEVDATAGVADTAPYAANFNTGGDSTNGHGEVLSPTIGNAVDDEWSGSMDFSLSTTAYAGTNIALFGNAHEIFDIGLSSAPTNEVNSGSEEEVTIHLRYKSNGNTQVTLSKTGNFRTLAEFSDAQMGWDPQALTNDATPFVTDKLNLSWTLRKTRVADTYSAVAVLSNTVSGAVSVYDDVVNDNFVGGKTNAYPASSVSLVMQHDKDADDDGTKSLIHIAIDELIVDQTSGNAPALESPVLTASGGNNQVDLSWTASLEATSYEVFRSITSGSFLDPAIGTTNGTSFVDTTALNNTTYYYFVRAKETGATDADSAEVSAKPQAAATGLVLDTDFSGVDVPDYADGDINGQNRWKDAALGTSPVFAITDAAGSGFANSEPYTNNFDNTLANDVYYNTIMSNNVGDEWTGSITFQVKAPATPGQEVISTFDVYDESGTNVVGSYTGTNDVSGLAGGELFKVGLTADPDSGLDKSDANDIFFYVRSQSSGRLDFLFNSTANSDRIHQVNRSEAGWDPNWNDTGNSATNGPDFVTDPITFNWTIRKTTLADTYSAATEVIVGSTTNAAIVTLPVTYSDSTDAYAAALIYFGMGIGEDADFGKTDQGSGTAIATAVKSVSIDALSLTKADNQPPQLIVPANILTDVADGTAIMEWDASIESIGYTVRNYSAYSGGSPTILTNGLIELTYSDTGLNNGESYFYTIAADYGIYGEAESDMIAIRPLGKATRLSWGYGVTVIGGGRLNFSTTPNLTNGVDNYKGTYTDGGFLDPTKLVTSLASQIYGIQQLQDPNGTAVWAQNQIDHDTPFNRLKTNPKDSGVVEGDLSSMLLYMDKADFEGGTALDLTTGTHSFEAQSFTHATSPRTGGGVRAAIRSGSQWYASETLIVKETTTSILDIAAEKWAPFSEADINSTNLMTVIGTTFAVVPGLNNIDGVGYFADHVDIVQVEGFKVNVGETATQFQLYMDGFNIYNDDADSTNDYDFDGVNNVHEWGTLGDPSDPGNNGRPTSVLGLDATGTNLVYVYPRLESPYRPVYTVLDTDNLVYTDFDVAVGVVEDGAGPWNPNNPSLGLEAVTNLVPIDVDAKFIGLEITE